MSWKSAILPLLVVTACNSTPDALHSPFNNSFLDLSQGPCVDPQSMLDCAAEAAVWGGDGTKFANQSVHFLDLGYAATGTSAEYEFMVVNTEYSESPAELLIDSIALSDPSPDSSGNPAVQCWDESGTEECHLHKWRAVVPLGLENGSTRVDREKFKLKFMWPDGNPLEARVRIRLRNVPSWRLSGESWYSFHVTAGGRPAIAVDPPSLDWGTVAPNTPVQRSFSVRNKGLGPLILQGFLFPSSTPPFTIVEIGGYTELQVAASPKQVTFKTPQVIPVGASRKVTVKALATDDKPQTGTITLFTNDPKTPSIDVPLVMNGAVP